MDNTISSEEREKEKKEMIIDGEPEAKKKHVSIGQVGNTKRIPSLPLKPPFDHVSWLHELP
jgi:hypothetical protein